MAIGLLGHKVGMTRIYGEDGGSTPVTVLEIAANRVSQVKTAETDGYNAIQLSVGEKKSSRVSKSEAGHFGKAGVPAGTFVRESRVDDASTYELGAELSVSMFEVGQKVDVTGISKGKGFTVKFAKGGQTGGGFFPQIVHGERYGNAILAVGANIAIADYARFRHGQRFADLW